MPDGEGRPTLRTDSSDGKPAARGILAGILGRPVLCLMVTASILLFGVLSYRRLPVALMPDVAYPVLTVRTELPGAAPEEVEQLVTAPVEQALEVTSNLVRVRSVSRAETSDVVCEFTWDAPLDRLVLEVRERLDAVRLPDEAERPLILRYDPSAEPILRVALHRPGEEGRASSDETLARLRTASEEILRRGLEGTEGVAAVRVRGGLEEVVRVDLNEEELVRTGLSVSEVVQRIGRENLNLPGGTLLEGRTTLLVRALNEFGSPGEIADLVVAEVDGVPVRLSAIARVELGQEDPDIVTRVDGRPSVEVEIYREADANLVEVAGRVRDQLERRDAEAQETRGRTVADALPPDLATRVVTDSSVFIERALAEIRDAAIWGALMAVLVLYLLLGDAGKTAIVGLSIPTSLVGTFAAMDAAGLSLNMMSLGGLALGVGMLVDNSIVCLESIARCREEGDGRSEASLRGTSEVAAALVASTLTTVCVFLPVVFVEGVAGQVFRDLALTVVFALALSLVVALTFVPVLAAFGLPTPGDDDEDDDLASRLGRALRPGRPPEWDLIREASGPARLLYPIWGVLLVCRVALEIPARIVLALLVLVAALLGALLAGLGGAVRVLLHPLRTGAVRGLEGLRSIYGSTCGSALERPLRVLLPAGVALVWTVLAVPALGAELVPEIHEGTVDLQVTLPIGTPLERTDRAARTVERIVREEAPEGWLLGTGTVVGSDPQDLARDGETGPHVARVTVRLDPGGDPARRERALLAEVRPRLARLPDVRVEVRRPALFTVQAPVEVVCRGPDLEGLERLTDELVGRMREIESLVDVRSTVQPGSPEVRIRYLRDRLQARGLDIREVAETVRTKVQGEVPTRFRRADGRRIDVVTRVRPEDREDLGDLTSLVVNPGEETPVRLGAVADVEPAVGPSEVRRIGQQRVQVVTANLAGLDLARATRTIERIIEGLEVPPGYVVEPSGQNVEMERSLRSLLVALGLAVFLVYVVMASLFEDVFQPMVILVSIPLAAVGAVVALHLLAIPLSIVVFIGLIVLVGIVVNNAIVLLDYANRLHARGRTWPTALREAGEIRLRPILMTTVTTVLGLLPMAVVRGEGAEIRVPLAITVIAGILASTLLTLYVIPTVASLVGRRTPTDGPLPDEPPR